MASVSGRGEVDRAGRTAAADGLKPTRFESASIPSVVLSVGIVIAADRLKSDHAAQQDNAGRLKWDKTFPPSDRMLHQKVSYSNRLGIVLVADLYVPIALDTSKMARAIVVGPPFGGLKEHTAGLYAQQRAERGFVTLALDPSYNGESGGQPRSSASPEASVPYFAGNCERNFKTETSA